MRSFGVGVGRRGRGGGWSRGGREMNACPRIYCDSGDDDDRKQAVLSFRSLTHRRIRDIWIIKGVLTVWFTRRPMRWQCGLRMSWITRILSVVVVVVREKERQAGSSMATRKKCTRTLEFRFQSHRSKYILRGMKEMTADFTKILWMLSVSANQLKPVSSFLCFVAMEACLRG